MSFWHRYYRKDLLGWKVTRIEDPASWHTPQKDVIWLDDEPANLDPTKMFYIEYDPALVPPISFPTNLPGVTTDAAASYITLGTAKSFTIAAAGGVPPYSYQWYKSNTSTPVGTNSPTYSIPNYAAGNNGDYWCTVTDSLGVTADSEKERVKAAVSLSTNLPANPPAWTVGTAASLAIVAANGLTPYTYQWQMSTNGTTWASVANGTASGITGATAATLAFATPQTTDAKQYRCIVTSANTNAPKMVTSAVATVTVNPAA